MLVFYTSSEKTKIFKIDTSFPIFLIIKVFMSAINILEAILILFNSPSKWIEIKEWTLFFYVQT